MGRDGLRFGRTRRSGDQRIASRGVQKLHSTCAVPIWEFYQLRRFHPAVPAHIRVFVAGRSGTWRQSWLDIGSSMVLFNQLRSFRSITVEYPAGNRGLVEHLRYHRPMHRLQRMVSDSRVARQKPGTSFNDGIRILFMGLPGRRYAGREPATILLTCFPHHPCSSRRAVRAWSSQ